MMEDEVNVNETTAPETQVSETTQSTTVEAPAIETKTEAKTETPVEKFEVPKKFLKADGTPDYARMTKSYINLEKAKPFIPAQSADEYEWQAPENGVELDADGLATFKSEALEQGFTTKQYQFLMNRYNDVVVGMRDAGPTAEKTEQLLKEEWGNDYDANAKAARAGFEEFAPSSADMQDPVWNHPEVMKLLARIGGEVREDSVSNKGSGRQTSMTEAEKDAIMQSKGFQDGDKELHAKVNAWYQAKYK